MLFNVTSLIRLNGRPLRAAVIPNATIYLFFSVKKVTIRNSVYFRRKKDVFRNPAIWNFKQITLSNSDNRLLTIKFALSNSQYAILTIVILTIHLCQIHNIKFSLSIETLLFFQA